MKKDNKEFRTVHLENWNSLVKSCSWHLCVYAFLCIQHVETVYPDAMVFTMSVAYLNQAYQWNFVNATCITIGHIYW